MAVCQMQSSANAAVTSYMASVRFVKHLVKVSLVNIVYHRVNVDPNAFEVRSVKEYKYMACKDNTEDPTAVAIYYAAKGIADAIENKYLREAYLILKDKDSDEVSEYYKFTLTYKENPDSVTLPKSEEVIKASIEFMKNIEMLGNYKKLSSNLDVFVEILLFSDSTPKDYMPPNFRRHIDSIPRFNRLPEFLSPPLRVGYVNTGYHRIKCRAVGQCFSETPTSTPHRSQLNRMPSLDDEKEERENEIRGNQEEEKYHPKENNLPDDNEGSKILNDTVVLDQGENCEKKQSALTSISTVSDISEVLAEINADLFDVKKTKYRCPCTIGEDIKGTENTLCSVCLQLQHTVCVGFDKSVLVPDPYVCIYCKRNDRPATDKILLSIEPQCWQDIAALRLALVNCKSTKDSSQEARDILNSLPKKIQYRACEMLKKAKVVERDENKSVKFNYQMVEDVSLRIFNVVVVPNSLQLGDGDSQKENASPEKKMRKAILSPEKTKKNGNITETSETDTRRKSRRLNNN